jgi:hypothetical protein
MDIRLLKLLRIAVAALEAERKSGTVDPREILRRKVIHELKYLEGKAPDGLSDAYIALVDQHNRKLRRKQTAEDSISRAAPLTQALYDATQEQIAASLMIERQLIKNIGAIQ